MLSAGSRRKEYCHCPTQEMSRSPSCYTRLSVPWLTGLNMKAEDEKNARDKAQRAQDDATVARLAPELRADLGLPPLTPLTPSDKE